MGNKFESTPEKNFDEYGAVTEEHAGISIPIEPYGPSGMNPLLCFETLSSLQSLN